LNEDNVVVKAHVLYDEITDYAISKKLLSFLSNSAFTRAVGFLVYLIMKYSNSAQDQDFDQQSMMVTRYDVSQCQVRFSYTHCILNARLFSETV
jgi:hypothetical protein